ncbi:hypothetical protein IWX46DRAFT_611395 [Phyllosticta citricarpa]|uniref:Secreted protein n=1 Tax=Phyllosticta citricarpa TaxID=55181 RepID=A0ABR1LLQ2_9PEZI
MPCAWLQAGRRVDVLVLLQLLLLYLIACLLACLPSVGSVSQLMCSVISTFCLKGGKFILRRRLCLEGVSDLGGLEWTRMEVDNEGSESKG